MAKKRKDKNGLVLSTGEYLQGNTYLFRYVDATGRRCSVSAKNLADLREKEKVVQRDLMDGIKYNTGLTLQDLFERWFELRRIKINTKENYARMWANRVAGTKLAKMKIADIKKSHVQNFVNGLMDEGLHKQSIKYILSMIKGPLALAVEDDLIRKNPCDNIEYDGNVDERNALSREDQKKLIEFVKNSGYNNHLPWIEFLLETGLRASEFCGLISSDIDEVNGRITIKRQLQYRCGSDGKYRYFIETPKTENGIRIVPLTMPVRKALREWNRQKEVLNISCNMVVDGVSGFIFCSHNGSPLTVTKLNFFLKNIVSAHNRQNAEPLAGISCHILRHTFCTRMVENGANPKVLAAIMGHSTCDITLQTYTNIEQSYACDEIRTMVDRLEEKEYKFG